MVLQVTNDAYDTIDMSVLLPIICMLYDHITFQKPAECVLVEITAVLV